MTNPIRVLLADDHPIVMAGFAHTLEDDGITVVAQEKTPDLAVQAFQQQQPDVAILDIRFGAQLTGLDAAREIFADFPDANIIFLSQFDQDALIKETYKLGARAFLTKDCDPAMLTLAVTKAAQGERYFMPSIAERLATLSLKGDDSPQSILAERDLEIFKLMAEGLTNAEIAERLDLSLKTISNTSQAIKEKLGIHRPAALTMLAVKHGLLQAE